MSISPFYALFCLPTRSLLLAETMASRQLQTRMIHGGQSSTTFRIGSVVLASRCSLPA